MSRTISPPAFVCLGDIHLDHVIWRRYRQISHDAFVAFASFVQVAITNKVPLVIVGDLFDSVDPDPELVRFFREQMDLCRDADCQVYAIQGNHDKRPIPWYVALHQWPQHIGDGKPAVINGIRVLGFDYAPLASIQDSLTTLSAEVSDAQVLFLHQAVRQALSIEGAWNCDLEWVPPSIPLIIMGDIHTQTDYRVRDGQAAHYTGSSHARDIGQIGPKSCCMVHRDLSVTRVPICYREIRKFIVANDADIQSIREWLEAVVTTPRPPLRPVAWVHHVHETAPECLRLASDYDGVAVVVLEAAKMGDPAIDTDAQPLGLDELLSKEALIARLADPVKEPEIYSLVLELVQSKDVNETISTAKARFYSKLQET